MDSCPKELEPFIKAQQIEMKRQDEMIWAACGNYVMSAVATAVEHCLAGRKAQSKYIEKPITRNMEDEGKELTEKELQQQRELFVARLMVKMANFELNNKKVEN